jgi:hypothetical protein
LSRNPDLDLVDQSIEYRVEGHISAPFTAHFAIGPDPISPFVSLAASIDRLEDFNFDMDFAKAMIYDKDLLNRVEEILNLRADENVDEADMTRAWLHLLASDLELPVSATIDYDE